MTRIGRFLLRHKRIMLHVHRLAHANPGDMEACWVDRAVWSAVLTPELQASIVQGVADAAAGRWYLWNDGDPIPNPDWPKDDPIQPHDYEARNDVVGRP
jgi:hypothetical protein